MQRQQVPRPGKQYEFPTGYTTIFHNERYLPGEIYFQQDAFGVRFYMSIDVSITLLQNQPNLPPTLPTLLHASIGACEPDLKAQLLANTVLTGGGSLLVGFPERLNNELNKLWPGVGLSRRLRSLFSEPSPESQTDSSWEWD